MGRKSKKKGKSKKPKNYKLKTHKATAKWFKVTGSGKLRRRKQGRSHLRRKELGRSLPTCNRVHSVAKADR